ncbi:MAG TPA: TIGR03435 family protein [Bryobacteraceae bacterium]|jgi:uncharacterized protein (TIGR03435 family)
MKWMIATPVLLVLCVAWAQTPLTARPAFEVASVKVHPRTPGPLRAYSHVQPAGIDFNNVALRGCIRSAYGMEQYRILGGPDWMTSERYDIVAKASAAAPKDQLMLMLQALLEDRFKLKVHRETRELPVYGLVVGKNGPKLRPGKEDGATEVGGARHLIDSRGMSMKQLAGFLSEFTQRSGMPVLDMTGLDGLFDITLDFAGDDAAAAANGDTPDIFTAVLQLGLKLEPRKSPLEVLVVDSAQKPSEN